jgi:hypothetical protein
MNIAEGDVYGGIQDVWVAENKESSQQLEDDSVEFVLKQQWRRYLYALSISSKMWGEPKEGESLKTLAYKGMHLPRDENQNCFQQKTEMMNLINKSWSLKKFPGKSYSRMKQKQWSTTAQGLEAWKVTAKEK